MQLVQKLPLLTNLKIYIGHSQIIPSVFLTREAHAQHELSWVVDKNVPRSMGCKLYANEVRSQLTFKLLSIFN